MPMRNAMTGALLLAVSFALPAAALAQSDADAKELASYRLSMDAVQKADTAMQVMVQELKKDPRFQARMKLAAEKAALEKKEERTEADDAKIEELKAKIEAMDDAQPSFMNNAKTLDEMEAGIRQFPPMAKGLAAAGMTPREYSKFMFAMIQASMAAGFKKAGLVKQMPKEISAENVKFIEEHEAELKALQDRWKALGEGEK